MTSFRFGVNTWTANSSREWVEKARQVEAFGYSTLFVADHLADTFAHSKRRRRLCGPSERAERGSRFCT